MDVQLRPPLNGCSMTFVTVLTLGLYALLQRMGERHFIRRMDDAGVVTRGGRRIAWGEFTGITHVKANMGGSGVLSDEYLLASPKGKVSLPLWRTVNAQPARDYLLQRLPSGLAVR